MVWIKTDGGFAIAQNQSLKTNPIFYICMHEKCETMPFVVTKINLILKHVRKHGNISK